MGQHFKQIGKGGDFGGERTRLRLRKRLIEVITAIMPGEFKESGPA